MAGKKTKDNDIWGDLDTPKTDEVWDEVETETDEEQIDHDEKTQADTNGSDDDWGDDASTSDTANIEKDSAEDSISSLPKITSTDSLKTEDAAAIADIVNTLPDNVRQLLSEIFDVSPSIESLFIALVKNRYKIDSSSDLCELSKLRGVELGVKISEFKKEKISALSSMLKVGSDVLSVAKAIEELDEETVSTFEQIALLVK